MSMRDKKEINRCTCKCGRPVYSLGEHKGFYFIMAPFFSHDWVIKATVISPSKLDRLLMGRHGSLGFDDCIAADTAAIYTKSTDHALEQVRTAVDGFYKERELIVSEIREELK